MGRPAGPKKLGSGSNPRRCEGRAAAPASAPGLPANALAAGKGMQANADADADDARDSTLQHRTAMLWSGSSGCGRPKMQPEEVQNTGLQRWRGGVTEVAERILHLQGFGFDPKPTKARRKGPSTG